MWGRAGNGAERSVYICTEDALVSGLSQEGRGGGEYRSDPGQSEITLVLIYTQDKLTTRFW